MKQNKEKRKKINEDSLKVLWDNNKYTATLKLQGSQNNKKKRKSLRKCLKKSQWKTSLTQEKNSCLSPGSVDSPIQEKEKHSETNIFQVNKN